MKRVLVSGYYGFGNCGDEAILYALIRNIKKMRPDTDIVVLSQNPAQTAREYQVKSIHRFNLFSIILQMLKSDLIISGGGSLLQDVTSTLSLYYYLTIISLAKLLHKPVILYANGIGPISKKTNRFLTKIILNKVEAITVRDQDSRQELYKLEVGRPPIIVGADPVFTLKFINDPQNINILPEEHIPTDRPLIGISVRPWKTGTDYLDVIARAADGLIGRYQCNILFIPMQNPDDVKIIQAVQKRMTNKSYSMQASHNIQEYMAVIGQLQMLISMRLHTLIFAAVQRVPMIGLVYDPKVQSFLDQIGQLSGGSVENLDIQTIYKQVEVILENREDICSKLQQQMIGLKERAEINDRMVRELLEK